MTAPIKPGDVLQVNEPDYKYGTGILRLRVSKVGSAQRLPDGEWVDLEGFTLRADGSHLATEPRHVLVRISSLRGALKRPEGMPSAAPTLRRLPWSNSTKRNTRLTTTQVSASPAAARSAARLRHAPW